MHYNRNEMTGNISNRQNKVILKLESQKPMNKIKCKKEFEEMFFKK